MRTVDKMTTTGLELYISLLCTGRGRTGSLMPQGNLEQVCFLAMLGIRHGLREVKEMVS